MKVQWLRSSGPDGTGGGPSPSSAEQLLRTASHARRRPATAVTCAAVLLTGVVVVAVSGPAAAAGVPASRARPGRPVSAYVVSETAVTPINTVTNKIGKPIGLQPGYGPDVIAITPNGRPSTSPTATT
jgi:hypothetical protein